MYPLSPLSRHRLSMSILEMFRKIVLNLSLQSFRHCETKNIDFRSGRNTDTFIPWRSFEANSKAWNAARLHTKSHNRSTSGQIFCTQEAPCRFFLKNCKCIQRPSYSQLRLLWPLHNDFYDLGNFTHVVRLIDFANLYSGRFY